MGIHINENESKTQLWRTPTFLGKANEKNMKETQRTNSKRDRKEISRSLWRRFNKCHLQMSQRIEDRKCFIGYNNYVITDDLSN